jgi:hemolysin D
MFKKDKIKDVHEFHPLNVEIEDRPLNPLGPVILWIVVAIITFGVLWLFFAKNRCSCKCKGSSNTNR